MYRCDFKGDILWLSLNYSLDYYILFLGSLITHILPFCVSVMNVSVFHELICIIYEFESGATINSTITLISYLPLRKASIYVTGKDFIIASLPTAH